MNKDMIKRWFTNIGASVIFDGLSSFEKRLIEQSDLPVVIDVTRTKKGEFFRLGTDNLDSIEMMMLDSRPKEKHLLLAMKDKSGLIHRYLCGHDERHWYVAAVPEGNNVRSAMEALKPAAVKESQIKAGVKTKDLNKRKNKGFIRQGEWFFIPRPDINPDPKLVHRNEPISRGRGSTPHIVEFLYREGGETVYVSNLHPNGLTLKEKREFEKENPTEAKRLIWQTRVREAKVFAKGKVRHKDHKTVKLCCWHEVVMNTEYKASGNINMVFLD